ncbi:MAG: NAD(P)-binding protein [Bacilli bacterium]|nr:NAD(P)-binding protein [Bacilli bacterium]
MKYDYLIVGAGLFGATCANRLKKQGKKVIFGGRLADYKYYDMDDVIKKALDLKF